MNSQTTPSPQETSCEVSQEHLAIVERIVAKFQKTTPVRLHDDIYSAGLLGLNKALSNLDTVRSRDTFIGTCVRNAIIDVLRMKSNCNLIPFEPETVERTRADAWESVTGVETPETYDLVASKEESDCLTGWLQTNLLTDTEKAVISAMREVDTKAEAARRLGVSKSFVSNHFRSAIAALKEVTQSQAA